MKVLKYPLIFLTAGVMSAAALASQATFVNKSSKPATVVYKVVHKNPGQPAVFDNAQTIKLAGNETGTIPFSLNGYKRAGVVPISVNDTRLPDSVTQVTIPEKCTTDNDQTSGNLTITYNDEPTKNLSCSVKE